MYEAATGGLYIMEGRMPTDRITGARLLGWLRKVIWRRAFEEKVKELRASVDARCAEFELDPSLPEIVRFKEDIPDLLVRDGEKMVRWIIDFADPREDIREDDGVFVMFERAYVPVVLRPWTVAEYYVPDLPERVTKIIVNRSGTHLYDGDGKEIVCFRAGVCDPHRLGDTGNRLRNAAILVNHYTRLNVTAQDLQQKYSATVEKVDGEWRVTDLSNDPATA